MKECFKVIASVEIQLEEARGTFYPLLGTNEMDKDRRKLFP
jgi:hypothetical protein